ncbi:MAG TPA: cytochrome P460 family protein [Rhizomicrobium sp.]|jgi:hypothetical protein|nr:cytochrome P460 family protein [Rhizomicrobium sp.]
MKRAAIVTLGVLAMAGAAAVSTSLAQPAGVVTGDKLRVPDNYRMTYESLGAWAIAADSGAGSKEMHDVYASPGAIAAFKKSHSWQDGTVLVKEVFATDTSKMTTGTVSHASKLKGWFVMVRDSKNSHPGSKLWGDGWGWSWFDAGKPTMTTSTDYHTDCQGCHIPAKATQWIYSQGYPVLQQ